MFRATSSASLCFESVFEGGNREEGGIKRAAPTHSARSLEPSTKDTAAHPPRPRCFGSARAQAAAGASVSSIKWDEHGAGLFWGSRGRSRHGGDPRPRAQPRSDRQSDCARFASILGASRSRGGGRSTACSRARARCSGGCGARREGPRGGSSHLALRRAGRGARREATMRHLAISLAKFRWQHARNRISAFSCWRQVAFGIAFFEEIAREKVSVTG